MNISNPGKLYIVLIALFLCAVFGFSPAKVSPSSVAKIESASQTSVAVANKPVKWAVSIDSKSVSQEQYLAKLPKTAENVKVSAVSKEKADELLVLQTSKISNEDRKVLAQASTGENFFLASMASTKSADIVGDFLKNAFLRATNQSVSTQDSKFINVAGKAQVENQNYIVVEYQTPGPVLKQTNTDSGETVTVSAGDIGYNGVTAYAMLSDEVALSEKNEIRVTWKNSGDQIVPFEAFDLNENGKIDYIEWQTSSLESSSSQTFEIIYISKAVLLDQNRNKLEDIYNKVQAKDGVFQKAENGQYVRVTFEHLLTSKNDITLFAKSAEGAKVEVYPVYNNKASDQPVATFSEIKKLNYYKNFLAELSHSTDTFDLKISGNIEIDYIVDPAVTILHSFTNAIVSGTVKDGANPYGSLTLSADGNTLYGMTYAGGKGYGTIFSISKNGGNITILHEFTGTTTGGKNPYGSLTLSADGTKLYGMTYAGGTKTFGTVFSFAISTKTLTILHSFTNAIISGTVKDGANPYGGLTLSGSTLYGMTYGGGNSGYGVIFSVSTTGTNYKIMHYFTGGSSGKYPYGNLTLSADGTKLYGMTSKGVDISVNGQDAGGNIFSITTASTTAADTFSVLFEFGEGFPHGSLTLLGNKLYGTDFIYGYIFSLDLSSNTLTVLGSSGSDGIATHSYYESPVFYGSTLYGMTSDKGGLGSIYSHDTSSGVSKTRYFFSGGTGDGKYPYGGFVISGSTLYGMTYSGGASDYGTIFSYTIDETAPTTTATAVSGGAAYTLGNWTKSSVTVTLACSDSGSGCASTYYCTTTSNSSCVKYSSSFVISSTGTTSIRYFSKDNVGNEEEIITKTINIETSAPSASIAYTNGYFTTASVPLTINDSDSLSGINTASRLIQRDSATLSNGTCGTYTGTYTTITPGGTYPNLTDTAVSSGKCYKYKYSVSDNAGNTATATSTSVAKIDTVAPSGGSITYGSGYITTTSTSITYSTGTDSGGSGLLNSSGKIQYATASLSNGSCGTFSTPNTLVIEYDGSYNASVSSGYCYKFQYSINDNAGNNATYTSSNVIKVDTTAPTVIASAVITGTSNTYTFGNWTFGPSVTVTLTCDDAGSGCASLYYCTYTGSTACTPALASSTSVSFDIASTTPLTKNIRYYTKDNAGNSSTTTTKVVNIAVSPVTTATAVYKGTTNPYVFDTWAIGSTLGKTITVTLTCTDATPVSKTIYACTDTVNSCTPLSKATNSASSFSTSFDVTVYSSNGYVRYYCSSPAGQETTSSKVIKLDPTKPVTTASAVKSDGSAYAFGGWTTPVTVTLACTDAGSGCASTYYCVGAGACDPTSAAGILYTAPVQVSTPGTSYFRYYSKDNVQNAEASKVATIKIDTSGPVTTVTAKTASGGAYTFGQSIKEKVSVAMSCADTGGAGCASTYYCMDKDNTCTPTIAYTSGDINVLMAGTTYFRYYSVDSGGNEEEVGSKIVRINNYTFAGAKVISAKTSLGNNWCLPGGNSSSFPGTQMTLMGGDGCDIADGGASDNGKCSNIVTMDDTDVSNPPPVGSHSPACPGSSTTIWSGLTNLLPETKYVIKLKTSSYCPGIYSRFAGNNACWVVSSANQSCSDICNKYGLTPTASETDCYNNAFTDCSVIENLKGSACTSCNSVAGNGYNYFDSKGRCYYTSSAGWAHSCSALGAGLTRICACEADNQSDNFYFSFTTPSSL